MVAIKIQSLEDIVGAYLQNLGFSGKILKAAVKRIADEKFSPLDRKDVLGSLERMLMKAAEKIYPDDCGTPEQRLALFKLVFLTRNGAERWGIEMLCGDKISPEAKKFFCGKIIRVAPPCCFCNVKAQVIEPMLPRNIFSGFSFLKGKCG